MHPVGKALSIVLCAVGMLLPVSAPADVAQGNFGARRPGASSEAPEQEPPKISARKSYPYYGFLEKVADDEKSIILKGKAKARVILVTPRTKIWNSGRKGTLHELVPGARVSGSVQKNEAGSEEALSIRFGERSK